MTHRFPATSGLVVEIARGTVHVVAEDITETVVELAGEDADATTVDVDGTTVRVRGPRTEGGLLRLLATRRGLDVRARVPVGSDLLARLGSGDLRTTGRLGRVEARTGSGDLAVAEAQTLETNQGSGDARIGHVHEGLRLHSASGDLLVEHVGGDAEVTSASGDVRLREVGGAVTARSASGDLLVGTVGDGLTARTASGDTRIEEVVRGEVSITTASGDVSVGVRSGVPTWTDVSSVARGDVDSRLEQLGPPTEGQDHVELRIRTVSGDISLHHARA